MKKRAVLLAGFGGPTAPEEVRPFIESVLNGREASPDRVEEVLRHYGAIGGISPYNSEVMILRRALAKRLDEKKTPMIVAAGFRHARPTLKEAIRVLARLGAEEIVVFVLSVFRSWASFGRYQESIARARAEAGVDKILFSYAESFHEDPNFIEAEAESIRAAAAEVSETEKDCVYYLFTAHSVPEDDAEAGRYAEEYRRSASLIAGKSGLKEWGTAYQSRGGRLSEPWLGPDVKDAVTALPAGKFKHLVVVPIGFSCENAEVLYDLDIETGKTARARGLNYRRAATVISHPLITHMIGRLVLDVMASEAKQSLRHRLPRPPAAGSQ